MKKISFALLLIILSFAFRTIWHVAPNVEFITTASLLSGLYLGKRWAFIVPFVSILLSDLVIGNTTIYLFTWSAYIMIGIVSSSIARIPLKKSSIKVLTSALFGLGSGFFFFGWTNFGVWFLDSWQMYPNNLSGLVEAYYRGLPFLRNTLVGTIGFSVFCVSVVEYILPIIRNQIFSLQNRLSHVLS